MAELTAKTLHGIWAGITMCWDKNDRFDAETYAGNIRRVLKHKVHGIYTTGSTGEFYALDLEEFKAMVDIQADLCGKTGMPLQIGCCSDATRKTLRMFEYAAGKKSVGAAQIVLPYWMEMTGKETLGFFRDIYGACPDLPIVHYNIPRAKQFLHGHDYLKILEVCPSLIGVKYTFAGSNFARLQDDLATTPQLSYFVSENLLVSAMQLGARGCYSSMVLTNPKYMLNLYAKARARKWDEAIKMQQHVSKLFAGLETLTEGLGAGSIDPVADKGLAVASGCLLGHQRCRAPYIGWDDQTVKIVRKWLVKNYPEFIYNNLP